MITFNSVFFIKRRVYGKLIEYEIIYEKFSN